MKLSINGRTYYGAVAKAEFTVEEGDSVFVDEHGHYLVHFTPDQTEALTRLGQPPKPAPKKDNGPSLGSGKEGQAKWAILGELADGPGEATTTELSCALKMDKRLVSKCLSLTKQHGLVQSRRPINGEPVGNALLWSITPKGRKVIQ